MCYNFEMLEVKTWALFTGTWRTTSKEVEGDVRSCVRDVIRSGRGVLTGGATGVDYFAMDETLRINPDASKLKVIIPAYLDYCLKDCYKNWCQKPITKKEIDLVALTLKHLRKIRSSNLIEMPNKIITQEHYDLRSEQEVLNCNEIYAFQVNNSSGTQLTLDFAKKIGVPIVLHRKYRD
jgi:hypothetical protein